MVWRPVNPNSVPKWQQAMCRDIQRRNARSLSDLHRKLAKTMLVDRDGVPLKGWAKTSAQYEVARLRQDREIELDGILRAQLAESRVQWLREKEESAPALAAAKLAEEAEAVARRLAYKQLRADVEQRRLAEQEERRKTKPRRARHVQPPSGWKPHMEAGLPDRFWLEGTPDHELGDEVSVEEQVERHPLDRPRPRSD